MSDWKSFKSQAPFSCAKIIWPTKEEFTAEHHDKPSYNEGDHITTYESPVWSTEEGSNLPITPTHHPCGYWTRNYVPPASSGSSVPLDGYLIGWYKFNEGSGVVVNNYAVDGSLGGGLLPDLTVIDEDSLFWSTLSGFASSPGMGTTQTFAYAEFDSRVFGGTANGYSSIGVFFKNPLGALQNGGFIVDLAGSAHNGFSAPNGIAGPPADRACIWYDPVGSCTDDGAVPDDEWVFMFMDDSLTFKLVLSDGTLLETGTSVYGVGTVLNMTALSSGCRGYDLLVPEGYTCALGSYGDWIIYNFTVPSLANWATWYDNLRTRYGMAARSGW